jgi:hypothetical protein
MVIALRKAGTGLVALAILATGLVLLQMPDVTEIIETLHAIERHGVDAVRARQGLQACDKDDLRVKICPSEKYGLTLAFWCEPGGAVLCPGAYTTIAGIEKTAFIRPCEQWRNCK